MAIVALSQSTLLFFSPLNNHNFLLPIKQQHLSTTFTQSKFSLTHLRNHNNHSSTQLSSGGDDSVGTHQHSSTTQLSSGGDDSGGSHDGGSGGGDGGGDEGHGGGDGGAEERNRAEAWLAVAEAGRSLESLPADLAAAANAGRIPGSVISRFIELEKSPLFKWLLQFDGFKERLLADDLFLTKIGIECGIGLFTKTAAELNKRKENFRKELDFVIADVIMALVADCLLVWLPAPTISLRPPLTLSVGPVSKFFYGCPDNAFQIAMAGETYSILQRTGSFVRNGAKLLCVGATSSVIGTGVTNLLLNARKAIDGSSGETKSIPMVPTSLAYGSYLSLSANLRYQVVAGIIEQRILEPLFHEQKLLLSTLCFAVRTGNTFLGSLMWVDYARLVGVQRAQQS